MSCVKVLQKLRILQGEKDEGGEKDYSFARWEDTFIQNTKITRHCTYSHAAQPKSKEGSKNKKLTKRI